MGWFDGKSGSSYKTDDNGNFWSRNEVERAASNGDLQQLTNGNFYDRDSRTEYWPDGDVKEKK